MVRKLLLSILLVTASCNVVYAERVEHPRHIQKVNFVLRNGSIFVKDREGITPINMAQFLKGLSNEELYRLMLSKEGFVFSDSEGSYSINVDLPTRGEETIDEIKKWVYKSLLVKTEEIV